ncbi:hypothetical protein D3H65_01745 [Paraflavitalea soli]|uniref:Carboxypeptidase regulatory-like domain-containing protein n=1 Tax=Paraflavitalea soli TaxID=2315862 RepID=A0A3B7MHW6_9BACT|nr:hypothetical protein [Paraflavitalea soli]AXY72769.1 hypothetical protein D3H65_01745 [Paraflavitalea soli]
MTPVCRKGVACLLFLWISTTSLCLASDPEYDEIPIYMSVPGVGSTEIDAVIYKETAFLSITDVFNFLKINHHISRTLDSVSGFFINPQATYLIEKKTHRITYNGAVFDLTENGIFQTAEGLYLRSDFFGQVFGLQCVFNFRSLSIILTTKLDLPVVKEIRQETMRSHVRQLTGELEADTMVRRDRPAFHAGMADWNIITTQNVNARSNTRFNLALGTTILGGETTLGINYDSYSGFTEKRQYYLWRHVNNENPALRQVMLGKIFPQASSSIFSPVVGIQFTNTPTTYRRSFGTYVLSDHTQPNWIVELYVNNILINYVRADASGFYTFNVPLVYGNTAIKLRFYGPAGEERSSEQNISIPFNFLPHRQLEYTVSGGMVEDSLHSRYGRGSLNYGLTKSLTVGGGLEYLSSVTTGRFMPFVNASWRLAANLLYSGEYIHRVRFRQVLTYRLPSNLQFELMYSRYKAGQKAIANTFLEERKAMVSYPFLGRKLSLFSRFTFYQIILPATKLAAKPKYTTTELLFSGVIFGVNTNLTTYSLFNQGEDPYVYSNLSATIQFPKSIMLTPQLQYEYNQSKLISARCELGKYFSGNGFASVFAEKNYKSNFESIGVTLRFDLSFAQFNFSARRVGKTTTLVEAGRGSLLYDSKTKYLGVSNRTSVGKGGITILPFLDLNGNGLKEAGEPRVAGLRVQISAARIQYHDADTSIVLSDLEAYTSYIFKLSTDAVDNVAWQLNKKVWRVSVSPNQLRLVEVPVSVVYEVSGMVMTTTGKGSKGLGGMIIHFYDNNGQELGKTITEADGLFNYAGLQPGIYSARLDPEQLNKLNLAAANPVLYFKIEVNKDGALVEGLQFHIRPVP